MQEKLILTYNKVVNIYLVYELDNSSNAAS